MEGRPRIITAIRADPVFIAFSAELVYLQLVYQIRPDDFIL